MRSMLNELRIVDLGVIGEASISPSPGFTAVTGETGAGKTMIVSGLSLLTGVKAEPRLIRAGASRALVEGRWALTPEQAAALGELGAELEDIGSGPAGSAGAEVLVTRQLAPNRSRMTVGGTQLPIGQGADLVGEWVTIHGQSEQLRLGAPQRQREVLDAYAGAKLAEVSSRYRQNFAARELAAKQLGGLVALEQERSREMDMLRFGLEEIGKAGPEPGEDVALA
ncbi:MAG: DNA repair protein RecN, partial [Propionibacteriaceae bacterium]|nr:DNA repair protein RecN [Propionibacteriaceae bacterium]